MIATEGQLITDSYVDRYNTLSANGFIRYPTDCGHLLAYDDMGVDHRRGLCLPNLERSHKVQMYDDYGILWAALQLPSSLT